jgi:hypothetical protein
MIAASLYLPAIYNYDGSVPTDNYDDFVEQAGCGNGSNRLKQYSNTFDCLVATDSVVLQNASGTVSTTRGYFGSFAFLPVIDGELIQMKPSEQLLLGKVSGQRLLVGVSTSLLCFQSGNQSIPRQQWWLTLTIE